MKENPFNLIGAALLASALFGSTPLQAASLLDSQGWNGMNGPYAMESADGTRNYEACDDFFIVGSIERVVVQGSMPNFQYQNFQGVFLRFYAVNPDSTPGALQAEYFLPVGDPNLAYDAFYADWFDVTLPTPFVASGRHFISIQQKADWWVWYGADARGATRFERVNGSAWSPLNVGLTYEIYGAPSGPGVISSVSPTSVARAGFVEVSGANFDGDGQLLVDGVAAPVSVWTPSRIVGYVPDAARLGTVPVQVVTAGGTSAAASLNVTARTANGRVNWMLRMDAPYSYEGPALALDGTVYITDVYARLYALAPNGAVKWVARVAGEKGLAVGADGTVYTASEDDVRAFAPDGTLKWVFVQNPRAFICQDMAVGPDGNVYIGTTEGMGIFSLTPQGQLRWQRPEPYHQPNIDKSQIVFGLNNGTYQMYFYANSQFRAIRLSDGVANYSLNLGHREPRVSPLEQSVHFDSSAIRSDGTPLWTFFGDFGFASADVGTDGTHYVTARGLTAYALTPAGALKWSRALPDSLGTVNVDPANRVLVCGGINSTSGGSNHIAGLSTANGAELWRVPIPMEYVGTRAVFTPDSSTAYVGTTMMSSSGPGAPGCSLYSIQVTSSAGQTLRSTAMNLSATRNGSRVSVTGKVVVRDAVNAAVAGVNVNVTWIRPDGTSVIQTATTGSSGTASFSTSGARGTYTLTVNNLTKSGYTFDAARSVLSKSITK